MFFWKGFLYFLFLGGFFYTLAWFGKVLMKGMLFDFKNLTKSFGRSQPCPAQSLGVGWLSSELKQAVESPCL
jgi:hypothetical protein